MRDVRLRSLALRTRVCVWVAALLLLAVPTVAWLAPEASSPLLGGQRAVQAAARELTPLLRLAGWSLSLPPFLVTAWGLGQFLAFCRQAEKGRVFTVVVATAIRRMGGALVAASVLLPVSRAALLGSGILGTESIGGVALPGGLVPVLPVMIGVTLGLVFLALGAVMTEAVRLSEENERFV